MGLNRVAALLPLLVIVSAVSAAPKKRTAPRPKPADATAVKTLGERVEKVWNGAIQPAIESGKSPSGSNVATITVIWTYGRSLAKNFEVAYQKVRDSEAGMANADMYIVRHSDTEAVGLVKGANGWRSFVLTLQGESVTADTTVPASSERIAKLLATFVIDPNLVGVSIAPWFRSMHLPSN